MSRRSYMRSRLPKFGSPRCLTIVTELPESRACQAAALSSHAALPNCDRSTVAWTTAVVWALSFLISQLTWMSMGWSQELPGQTSQKGERTSHAQTVAEKDSVRADQEQNQETTLEAAAAGQNDGKTRDLTFDSIQFPMEPGEKFRKEMLTKEIIALDKQTVRIRGFIRPSFKQTGLSKFVFVRDNQECCFGPGAALYDCILVELADGVEIDYTLRPITLLGTFYFKSYKGPDGEIWAIYRMREATVE